MKQMYLIVYLESKGCEEVRVSKNGYYVMRNKSNNKITGVPLPSNGKCLKDETICNICNTLEVETPPETHDELEQMMVQLKIEVENKIKK